MRFVPFALAALVAGTAAFASVPVEAQETRIVIRKQPPRSFLDPGPVVKPGTSRDLNYVSMLQPRYPQYGDVGGITGTRYPLPSRFELPNY